MNVTGEGVMIVVLSEEITFVFVEKTVFFVHLFAIVELLILNE